MLNIKAPLVHDGKGGNDWRTMMYRERNKGRAEPRQNFSETCPVDMPPAGGTALRPRRRLLYQCTS